LVLIKLRFYFVLTHLVLRILLRGDAHHGLMKSTEQLIYLAKPQLGESLADPLAKTLAAAG
jgi:hypothetical protein